jgi:uncharacterized protein (DUF58 family)
MVDMEPSGPSLLRRAAAILVLLLVAVLAVRLAFGVVAGLVTAALWIGLVVALVAAALWARSTLKSAGRKRAVKREPAAREVSAGSHEDAVAAEMRRITEQLREQGRR